MSSPPDELSPKHVRAARALLAWSQQDLAKAAGVGTSTVADFERGQRTPVANNAQAMRRALEGAGIRFLATGAVIGPAIQPIGAPERAGAPVRWVSAEDLDGWANRTDGIASLPTLLSHLIRATHGPAVRLRFPSDESVRYPGWDGYTLSDAPSTYVPQGEAGWEIGAQRSNIAQKASADYAKRTAAPVPLDPAKAAYVFVTPRRWPDKHKWIKARQEEGVWREVRAYDADDLVHWIEQTPAIGLWLAARLEKYPPGTRQLETIWEEWSRATQWPLTEDLVLSDRDQDAAEILRWLRGAPSVLSLQATTAEEVAAFFHATLGELPEEVAAAYRTRCLVATTADAARGLATAPAPLILVLTDPESGLAASLAARGHYVLQAYDERLVTRGEVRTLARPSREGIASALGASGIATPRAEALARDCARNLAVLRRLIPAAPGHLPKWADGRPPHALLAALLAGGWDEDAEFDRALLSEIAGQPYGVLLAALTPYLGALDSPVQKVGSTWRIAAPSDAWFLLAHHLTPADVGRFEAAANAVLGSLDPRFDLEPDERWLASVRGVHRAHSGLLRHGIGQTLILLALWGDRLRAVPDAPRRAEAIVAKLFHDADRRRWWSLAGDFSLLSEAAPGAFLAAIEDSLDHDDPPITVLFERAEGGIAGTEYLSDLMWALESLAWSPDWMPRVTQVLARLDAIDTKPRRQVNGPANSLREIHLLWMPQTYAPLSDRLRALDLVRKLEPAAAWKLMLAILPQGRDMSMPTPMPRWRDFSVDKVEDVTWALVARGAAEISKRLIEDVGISPERWSQLLDRIRDLAPEPEPALAALEAVEPRIVDPADRAALWDKLRRVLHHHREFPDADWSLPSATLDRLDILYARFAPADPIAGAAWLFGQTVMLPAPSTEGWEAEERDIDAARRAAVGRLYAEHGNTAILALARRSEAAGYIGKAIYDIGLPAPDFDALLEASLCSADAQERDVAHGMIISAFRDRGEGWGAALIARAVSRRWGKSALQAILRALPVGGWTWDRVAEFGGEIEATYWRQMPVFWMSDDGDEVARAVRMLIDAGRARHALPLAARGKKVHLPTGLLVELLQEAARQPIEGSGHSDDATMFQHYVAEILRVLDEREDVGSEVLATLEWNYLRLLEHSRRPPKALLRALSEQPPLFIRMLRAVFKPREESGVSEPEPEDPEQAALMARQAYRLLGLWDRIPGTRDDGTIDGVALEAWIKEARSLAKAAGREEIADSQIGTMLSASPMGADGNWPAEPIRDAIDLFRSKPMIEGFHVGKSNRRGVTSRMPRDGGQLERREAEKYRTWAKALAYDHPHTAKALDTLAERYEWHARREDEDAERLDWHV